MKWTMFWVRMFKATRNVQLLKKLTMIWLWCDIVSVAIKVLPPAANDNG